MNPHPFDYDTIEKQEERHRAVMDKTALYTTDPGVWEEAARGYRARLGGRPTFRTLEGAINPFYVGLPQFLVVFGVHST